MIWCYINAVNECLSKCWGDHKSAFSQRLIPSRRLDSWLLTLAKPALPLVTFAPKSVAAPSRPLLPNYKTFPFSQKSIPPCFRQFLLQFYRPTRCVVRSSARWSSTTASSALSALALVLTSFCHRTATLPPYTPHPTSNNPNTTTLHPQNTFHYNT